MKHDAVPHVAVLVETSTGWGRQLIRGIAAYTREYGPWNTWIDPYEHGARLRLPRDWRGQGILARVSSEAMARHVAAAGIPVVNVSTLEFPGVTLPQVSTDLRAAARLAAKHFLDRGFRNFAYYGLQRPCYVEHYRHGFLESLAEAGCECSVYRPQRGTGTGTSWTAHLRDIVRWLKGLPTPVALLVWPARRGRDILYACRQVGLLVPEQVAVLVGDDDDLLCEESHPSLSGIVLNSQCVGYEAAVRLDRLMRARRIPKAPLLVTPSGVISRQSTDTLAIQDADVVSALTFIRNHVSSPIGVKELLRAVPVSRRVLERRFLQLLGRTPGQEIRRVRLERAKRLLAETDWTIPKVATASGFGSSEYLAYVFKCETGTTPRDYRSTIRRCGVLLPRSLDDAGLPPRPS